MRISPTLVVLLIAAAACSGDIATAQGPQSASAQRSPTSSAASPQQSVQWSPAPPIFPAGAEIAVMQGDPSKAGEEFTVRLRFPNGYRLAPHTHPTTENVTVLGGTFLVGMGSTFEESGMLRLGRDGFVSAPAEHPHYAMARGETVVQVHAIGPFALTYVNPADDPTKR
ncbi:MAG TPA: cupin domain-containing protein [Gemmatimonadaceae bacterium]|nr:cupin domain-containing protein [Gemmatimonadaceae bacterium]